MQTMQGLVSIVIITNNQKMELCATINSILQQEYECKEIIVVDNNSSDGSYEYIQEQFATVENLFYLISDTVESKSVLLNAGIDNATGEYIAFAESGTIWKADKLVKQVKILSQNNDFGWVYCTTSFGKEETQILTPPVKWPLYKKQGNILPDLLMNNYVNLSSVCLKRSVFEGIGGLDEDLFELAEYEFLLRVAEHYGVAYMEEIGVYAGIVDKALASYIAAQCYIMVEFSTHLSYFGLKKEKLMAVMGIVEQYQQWQVFEEYKEFLIQDEEYAKYLSNDVEDTREYTTVHDVQNCIGCGVCALKCPVEAITMEYNREGFLRPVVNEEKCIHCGCCLSFCANISTNISGTPIATNCYAVQSRDEFRRKASSGGVFPLLADYILQKGGYVAGAVFTDRFRVEHVITNRKEVVEKMCGSKYVASNVSGIYAQVEKILAEDKMVLYTGCACQIAALKLYLGKEYNNLYTVDVVCHGVPSPGVWNDYIDKFEKEHGRVQEVSFRKKEKLGWNSGLYILFADGREYIGRRDDAYIKGFLNNWLLQDACYDCKFKKRKYSDITLGDFWGINNIINNMDDGKGTSFVTVNTKHGLELWARLSNGIAKCEKSITQNAAIYNPCISKSVFKNKTRQLLFEQLQNEDLDVAVNKVFDKQHYDVGLIYYWGSNYGNAMTNYALYQVVSRKYKTLAVDNLAMRLEGRFLDFAKRYMTCSSDYFPTGSKELIKKACDTYIVGSDQAWNTVYERQFGYGKYFQLDFIENDKKKVSYAASFGQRGCEPKDTLSKELYRQFDSISVRESFGVDICREEYGVDAVAVLDPVFLLKREEYHKLTSLAEVEKEKYMLVFLLNPTKEKREACKKIQAMLGNVKMINITEEHPYVKDKNRHVLEFENVKTELEVEQWLYYFENSSFIVTDSFHGTCFSIIFHKPFFSFVNRQSDRFEVFKQFKELNSRIIEAGKEVPYYLIREDVDYDKIEEILEQKRQNSLRWLEEAISKEK